MKRVRLKKVLYHISTVTYCLVIFIIIGLPLYMVLINSFKPYVEIFGNFISFPKVFDFSNFIFLFEEKKIWLYIINSVIITGTVAFTSFVINPFIAYKIAMNWENKFFRIFYYVISSAMFIPSQVIFFPLIRQYYVLNLMNHFGLIIYYAVFMLPESIFLMVPHFRLFKKNLRNVAYLDGCKEIRFYFRIFIPICRPVILTVTILSAVWTWNDFFMPLMILNTNPYAWTLPIFIFRLMGRYNASQGIAFSAIQIAMIPVVIFYIFFHKKITRGFSIKNARYE